MTIKSIEITRDLFRPNVLIVATWETYDEQLPCHKTLFGSKEEFLEWLSDHLDEVEIRE